MIVNGVDAQLTSWTEQAACRGVDPEMFFAGGPATARAKRVCWDCPVQQQCLQAAVDADERYGVWGGKTSLQRLLHRVENDPHASIQTVSRLRNEVRQEQRLESTEPSRSRRASQPAAQ